MLNVRCGCRGKPRIPLRMSPDGLVALRSALNGKAPTLDPATPFQTYYCDDCREVTTITFGDLMIAA